MQGFGVAQQTILSKSNEKDYCDVGTTTILGGGIVQLQQGTWGFVSAGIGDCKAYHFSLKDKVKVSELTVHPFEVRKDKKDPGGRLGPYQTGGEPDLRNFHCWFQELLEGDIVLICSDGIHDNLDPEVHGMKPPELGLDFDDWNNVDDEILASTKSQFASKLLSRLYKQVKKQNDGFMTMEMLSEAIVQYCFDQTQLAKEFMEQFPNKHLPSDYSLFPGKLDHITCVCVRVKHIPLLDYSTIEDHFKIFLQNPSIPSIFSGDTCR
eukprot:TRINITY_DN12320_c0_g1_i4.p1 TRINITY_DN12320_c0_g1~~TRINITY_DN12320_c0_g1_i4.p1  ORF type:complete len:265 (-),score=62.99 TRINITY_DN12320_c0_g1_i4:227-1021(-)